MMKNNRNFDNYSDNLNHERSSEQENKKGLHGMNFVILCFVIIIFMISAVSFSISAMKANEKKEEIEEKKQIVAELESSIRELEYYLDLPMDSAYVAKIAHEKLNMYFPDEIIVYGGVKK